MPKPRHLPRTPQQEDEETCQSSDFPAHVFAPIKNVHSAEHVRAQRGARERGGAIDRATESARELAHFATDRWPSRRLQRFLPPPPRSPIVN